MVEFESRWLDGQDDHVDFDLRLDTGWHLSNKECVIVRCSVSFGAWFWRCKRR